MTIKNDDELLFELSKLEAAEADKFASNMDDMYLDIADLNPEICPPDRRIFKRDKEAWVYEHGNIAELVFVKTG